MPRKNKPFKKHIYRWGSQRWDYVTTVTTKHRIKQIREFQKHYHDKRIIVLARKGGYGIYSRPYLKRKSKKRKK
ncbi:unnamed protein product [marine sediment metagenome]|uniref:Uncharacterized protein n=1 Tax=marine sediment metagenome TaxID=412755 RepID=X1HLH6_9ZZZZ